MNINFILKIFILANNTSTTSPKNIEEHVRKFLLYKRNVYGDTRFTEFDDDFLNQHVISVSVVDTELVSYDRQVSVSTVYLIQICLSFCPSVHPSLCLSTASVFLSIYLSV